MSNEKIQLDKNKTIVENIKSALDQKRFNEVSDKEKHTIFQEISTLVIQTDVYDLLGQIDDLGFSDFIVPPTLFGTGYRILFNDLLDIDTYDGSGAARYPQDTNRPDTREIQITGELKIKIRNDFKDVDYTKHFANSESMASFIANQIKRTNDTYLVMIQCLMKRLFGAGTESIPGGTKTGIEKAIDNLRSQITNVKNVEVKKKSEFIKEIWKEIIKATSGVSNKNNIGKGKYKDGSDAAPLHNNVREEDLVIIMNPLDILDFNWDELPTLFNKQNTFKLPEPKKLMLDSVPSGTAYLIDKRVFQFQNLLDRMYSVFNEFTLETLTVRHIWLRSGFVPYCFGMKIVSSEKKEDKKEE
ncbi:MAG: hypothetical protein E7Y34_00990 [Mycoplasma sp.]|nr:hypothetical protein [Mycoplasma sp.]